MKTTLIFAGIVSLGLSTAAMAQDVFVYPKDGQSAQQQSLDLAECRNWATGQTGYIPNNYAASQAGKGKIAKNTAIGAFGGAAGGAALGQVIGGKPGLGAAAGAGLGALFGSSKGRSSKRESESRSSRA